jgi:L-lactate dehydrogenase complex protein LldF
MDRAGQRPCARGAILTRLFDVAPRESFAAAALPLLRDQQLRHNVAHATDVIQAKRAHLVSEKPDWAGLRNAGAAIRDQSLAQLDTYLLAFESKCVQAGGVVHWAADAAEARAIILRLIQAEQVREVIKIKSMATAEIALNPFLLRHGIFPQETDLAELILQLGNDEPSHIVVPALHKNRQQIRALFQQQMHLPDLSDDPPALAEAARQYLRQKFLEVPVAICGANFLIAETGSVCIVESEGNGRMCLTLPRTLIALVGIEKVIPRYQDLEVLLQTLPRSATGERMNPYNSLWTGVTAGDGPQHFHVVLLDNGRSNMLADPVMRQTLRCIRCGACQNTCPVYRQTGGHAYGPVYGGPIGAILSPQLAQMHGPSASLPYASSLCGACQEVCPVAINIPEVLIELRSRAVQTTSRLAPERVAMRLAQYLFSDHRRLERAHAVARATQPLATGKDGWIHKLPGLAGEWTRARDLQPLPMQSFRDWWAQRETTQEDRAQ